MSDNPFATPAPVAADAPSIQTEQQPAPSLLTVICILCIILGVCGILGNCMFFASTWINNWVAANMTPDPAQAEMNRRMQEIQGQQFVPSLIFVLINFVIAALLIIGSIGLLRARPASFSLMRIALLSAGIFVLVRGIAGIIMQLMMKDDMMAIMSETQPAAEGFMEVWLYIVIALSGVLMLLLAGFYLGSYKYVGGQKVRSYLSQFE